MQTQRSGQQPHSQLAPHGMGRMEFVCMASLITATMAISIDTLLPAFDEIEETYDLANGGLAVSLAITVFFGALGLGNLFWGPLADRFGRKKTMNLALLAVIVGAIVTSFAPNFELFLAGRVFWGFAAAGPRTVIVAMTRDSYDGDDMSRIMSLTQAIFLVVPILAPALGEGLLFLGSWRLTTLAAAALAVVATVWFSRAQETLDPADVLPLQFSRVGQAAKAVVTNRTTMLFTLAATMTYAAFLPWLGSSPALINDIYGRSDQFALIFGANAVLMAIGILITEKLVRRLSTMPVVIGQTVLLLMVAVVYVVWSLTADGVPSFWVWFALASLLTALNSAASPLLMTLAMQPMGAIAGTAASVIGAIMFLGGAALASIVDRAISDTVTPFGVGFVGYGAIVLLACLAARRSFDESGATADAVRR